MDPLENLTRSLEPLGGSLLLDRFMEALAAAARPSPQETRPATRVPVTAQAQVLQAPGGPGAPTAAATTRVPSGPGPSHPEPVAPSNEIEAFMSRDEIEGTSDDEVQQFLKERAGYDPSELE